jgi:hypothetical protein
MTVKKTAKKKASAKKTVAKSNGEKLAGYKGEHQEGSSKGKAHELFDKAGGAKASKEDIAKLVPKIEALGIKTTTVRSWFGAWRRED